MVTNAEIQAFHKENGCDLFLNFPSIN